MRERAGGGWSPESANAPAAVSESSRRIVGLEDGLEVATWESALVDESTLPSSLGVAAGAGKWATFDGKHNDCVEGFCDPPTGKSLIDRHLDSR